MTSGTFVRVRLFTDIEDITLDKWLDAENAGDDQLAKKILDAGLLVEHMIAEIPLEQNLADNSELKELADNADKTFGLVVCFGCNRAFQSENDQTSTCPNCGARLSRPDLTPTNIATPAHKKSRAKSRHTTSPSSKDNEDSASSSKESTSSVSIKKPTSSPSPPSTPADLSLPAAKKNKHNKKHVRESSAERKLHSESSKDVKSSPSPKASRPLSSKNEDEEESDGWFGNNSPLGSSAKHSVKSH